jgi:hypothetical protein
MVSFKQESSRSVQVIPRDPVKEALDVLLDEDKSDAYKGRVLELVRKHKIDANDPIFLLVAGISNIDVALVDAPQKIDAILTKFDRTCLIQSASIKQITDKHLDEFREEAQKEVAEMKSIVSSFKNAVRTAHDENKILCNQNVSLRAENEILIDEIRTLVTTVQETKTGLKLERELRIKRPFLNAVNLPAYYFLIGSISLLLIGTGIGWKITDQSTRLDKIDTILEKLDPDAIHITVQKKSAPKKKHKN